MAMSIAAKNVELDPMPTSLQILNYHPDQIPKDKESITEVERIILKTVNWDYLTPTVNAVVRTFLSSGILFTDDEIKAPEAGG